MSNTEYNTALENALQVRARKQKVSVLRLSKKAVAEVTAAVNAKLAESRAAKAAAKVAASPKRTKKDIAADVFAGMAGDDVPRKDVVLAISEKAELSIAGARNYYQRFFSGEWDV